MRELERALDSRMHRLKLAMCGRTVRGNFDGYGATQRVRLSAPGPWQGLGVPQRRGRKGRRRLDELCDTPHCIEM